MKKLKKELYNYIEDEIPNVIFNMVNDPSLIKNDFSKAIRTLTPDGISTSLKESATELFTEFYTRDEFRIQEVIVDRFNMLFVFYHRGYYIERKLLNDSKRIYKRDREYVYLTFLLGYSQEDDWLQQLDNEMLAKTAIFSLSLQVQKCIAELYLLIIISQKKDARFYKKIDIQSLISSSCIKYLLSLNLYRSNTSVKTLKDEKSLDLYDYIKQAENKLLSKFTDAGRKGGLSTHSRKSVVEKIANDTWMENPLIPVGQLAEKINEYEKNNTKMRHPPSLSAINTWLRSSERNPKLKGRQKKVEFNLIIKP